jgi:polyhydroxybutyrate depolymerase
MANDLHRRRSRRALRQAGSNLAHGAIRVDGIERTFLVQPGPQPSSPLLVVLHGGGGQGPGTVGLTDMARRGLVAGFATVFPDGLMRGWNDGRTGTRIARRSQADDVAFLVALIDHLGAVGVADPSAAFCCGISNGAFMSDRLARVAPERVAGIGLVAGTSGVDTMARGHASARPVPVMMFHGTDDPLVPYLGGPVGFNGTGRGPRRSRQTADQLARGACVAAEALALDWARVAGHDARPAIERIAPPGPGLGVVRLTWQGIGGAPVVLHRIEGGGHTWPGGPQYLPARVVGKVAAGLDATGILLAYFRTIATP